MAHFVSEYRVDDVNHTNRKMSDTRQGAWCMLGNKRRSGRMRGVEGTPLHHCVVGCFSRTARLEAFYSLLISFSGKIIAFKTVLILPRLPSHTVYHLRPVSSSGTFELIMNND